MARDRTKNSKLTAFAAVAFAVVIVSLYVVKERSARAPADAPQMSSARATFVGRERCKTCHENVYERWRGSHHDHAMAVATDSTVLGDFSGATFERGGRTSRFFKSGDKHFVHTQGADGEMQDFEVAYTFGVEPLQQYLVPFPGGRLQSLTIAWDTERGEWFDMYPGRDIQPDDWLHWTRGGQNWNGMCAECHSTNLQKGYDPTSRTFNTTWSEIDVSCEACHGPGSRHVEWAANQSMPIPDGGNFGLVVPTGDITSQQQVELCAPCHSRRTEFGDYDHSTIEPLDKLVPTLLEEGLYHADGQILDEVYVYGSFVQSKMYRNNVRCSDCHDVHSLKLVAQGNALCVKCHVADTYDTPNHHFHPESHDGRPSEGALCVKCHMPEQPYMVIDYRADHSFRVPRPDLTLEIGTPNACNQRACHDDRSAKWADAQFTKWYGRARRPHYGTALHAGREGAPDADVELTQLARDESYPAIVRATALALLRDYPGGNTTRAFSAALSDVDPLVRYTAAQHAIAPEPQLMDLLTPLLSDSARTIRCQAAARLAALAPGLLAPQQAEALQPALEEYRKAMEHSLDFSFAGYNLGNLYADLGRTGEAVTYYRAAIDVDGLFYPAKMNLAMIYNSTGRNAEAESLLREVVADHPDLREAAYSLALLLAEMSKYTEAAEFFARAAEGPPVHPRAYYNLGLTLQHLQRWPEAQVALEQAMHLDPHNADYAYALADHHLKRGRLREALRLAERLTATHPQMRAAHQLEAYIKKALQATRDKQEQGR